MWINVISSSSNELDELLSIRLFRKTDRANAISYKNILLSFCDKNDNKLRFNEKSPILILETLKRNKIGKYMNETIKLKKSNYEYLVLPQKTI